MPSAQWLLEGQTEAQREVDLANPLRVEEREASRTRYEGLDAARAAVLAREAFPGIVSQPDGALPQLAAGEHLGGFVSDNAARVSLPGGRHGVIVSQQPMAVETSPGVRAAVDLGFDRTGGAFGAKRSGVAVRLPADLAEGLSLPSLGFSLTPLAASGKTPAVASPGDVNGYSMIWSGASMGRNVDVLGRPTPTGMEMLAMLRSQSSPEVLRFRVGIPAGTRLVQQGGSVELLAEGRPVAIITPPRAYDAQGTDVPVSMTVSGGVLTLNVRHAAGNYAYPVMVDPTVVDTDARREYGKEGNWWFYKSGGSAFEDNGLLLYIQDDNKSGWEYKSPEYGLIGYETQGESRIYKFVSTTRNLEDSTVSSSVYIGSAGAGVEGGVQTVVGTSENTVCAVAECAAAIGTSANWANGAFYKQSALTTGKYKFEHELTSASVYVVQEKGPSVSFITANPVGESGYAKENGYGGRWASPEGGGWAVSLKATDPGTGVYEYIFSSPQALGWGKSKGRPNTNCYGIQCAKCAGDECPEGGGNVTEWISENLRGLPDGEDKVKLTAQNASGESASSETVVKIDGTAPYNVTLTGLPEKSEVSERTYKYKIKASATDGTAPTPSSGIASIVFSLDGHQVEPASGKCSPGPCTASSEEYEWTLNAWELAAGLHTFTATATDGAGNASSVSRTILIRRPQPVALGPGSVDPVSGEFGASVADVSIAGNGPTLSVERSYESRHLSEGVSGPLGPQWALSLDRQPKLINFANESMMLVSPEGSKMLFSSSGGHFTPPAGDANLSLRKGGEGGGGYVLENASTKISTTFELPGGELWQPEGSTFMPTITQGPVPSDTVAYSYQMVEVPTGSGKKIIRPRSVEGPAPEGVYCKSNIKEEPASELNRGCRALTFGYATSTTATGETPEKWGDHEGYLARVKFTAWNSTAGALKTVEVARYQYDSKGQLRSVWDPRISPALKIFYGYDSEGHVTALSSPGQQPWLLNYGTDAAETGPGRLLSVARPSASTAFGNGSAPSNTASPTLSSTSPVVGTKISVSGNGTWSNSPLFYSYQWEDCNSSGAECAPIAGAVNQSYYPTTSDESHKLVAQVVASNAYGTVVAASAATNTVAKGTPNSPAPEPPNVGSSAVWTVEYGVPITGAAAPYPMSSTEVEKWGQKDFPVEAAAIFTPDEPMGWPAKDYKKATVSYLDAKERNVNVAGPGGGISTTEYNETNDVVRSLGVDARAEALKEGEKSAEASQKLDTQSTYNSEGNELLSTLGPRHLVKLGNGKEVQARSHVVYHYDEGAPSTGGPYRLVTKLTQEAQTESEGEQDVRTSLTSYSGQENLGWTLRKPTSVLVDPGGLNLVHSTVYNPANGNVVETGPPGAYTGPVYVSQFGTSGTGNGQLKTATAVAFTSTGAMWVADSGNNRIEEFSSTGSYLGQFGSSGTGNGQFKSPRGIAIDSKGDLWVVDAGNFRVQEFSSTGVFIRKFGASGSEAGQFFLPYGIAIDSTGNVWVGDSLLSRIQEFSAEGVYIRTVGSEGTGNGQFKGLFGITFDSGGHLWAADSGDNRIEEFSSTGGYLAQYGVEKARNIAFDSAGNIWVAQESSLEEMSSSGALLKTFGSSGEGKGQFVTPGRLALDTSGNLWVPTSNRVEEISPSHTPLATGTQTIYYTAAANPSYPTCGGHAEWSYLTCETLPNKQPGTSGLPALPVTTVTYNLYDEPLVLTSTTGASTRTTTNTYDEAGRPSTSETTSTSGTSLPKVTDKYSETTGAVTEQSTSAESLKDVINSLGQMTSYTDADGNISTFEYETENGARLKKVNDGKGTQTYIYDETTGALKELVDSSAGTFTASYDAEGNMTAEGYPNGLSATYTFNPVGQTTGLSYVKTTHCATSCEWFKDSVVLSIHGQWLGQTSSFGQEKYTYDQAGRLTETQATPTGKGCVTHRYSYDEETNRLALATYQPNVKSECSTETPTTESHTYDSANRLMDTGVGYSPFGDIEKLPAADAGGSELKSSFYVDNQVASQTQGTETVGYNLDPSDRPREMVYTGKVVASEVLHYASGSSTPAWIGEPSAKWTRNINGMNGLDAIQHGTETPILQLSNLHGDIVATVTDSETVSGLTSTIAEPSEYGVPATEAPPKYSWLGSHELPTTLPSGVIAMGARSYVPQLGRFLQPDPIPGGSANAYSYVFGDPVDSTDLSGERTSGPSSWAIELASQLSEEETAVYEAALRAEAERKAEEAASFTDWWEGIEGLEGGEEEEWEEWEEEEWEYASLNGNSEIAEGVFSQPLSESDLGEEGKEKAEGDKHEPVRKDVEARCRTRNGAQCKGNSASHSPVHHYKAEAGECSPTKPCGQPPEPHLIKGNTPEEKAARGFEEVAGKFIKEVTEDKAMKELDG